MRILLADDHQLFREGLRTLLELEDTHQIVDEVDNTEALLESVQTHQPDLVIQDYRMPNGGAISVINTIKEQFPGIKLIMLTGVQSGDLYLQLIKSKADGILLKDVSAEFLLQAIDDVQKGERVFSPAVAELLKSKDMKLTSREFQVLEYVVEGLNNSEISDKLYLTSRTVENHRFNLMKKLNVHNVAELIKVVRDQGILFD
jgi:DNA-binding NarL/FixJ family response regulator